MNDFGNELFKTFEILIVGTDLQKSDFTKGLIILQNEHSDFFKNAPSDRKLITDYFAQSNLIGSTKSIVFKNYDKLPPDLELEVVDLFKSVFTE